MAATERAVFPTGNTIASAASNATQSVTVVSGDVLEAQVTVSANADAGMVAACTANGVAADGSSATIHSNTQTNGFEKVFYWLAPSTGTYNVVASVSGGTPDSIGLKVRALAGTDAQAPTFVTTGTPNDTTTRTAATSGAVAVPNNGIGISHWCSGTSFSSTGQTTDCNGSLGGASAATEMAGCWAAGTGGNVTFTATISAADYYGVIVSVWAAPGAAVPALPWTKFTPGAALKRKQAIRQQGPIQGGSKVIPGSGWFTDAGLGGAGNPLLLVSAEDWGLLANASYNHGGNTTATWDDYFTSRAAQGYNCVQVSMFGYGSGAGFGLDGAVTPEGGDVDSVYPFNTNSNNPSNANNTTWWDRRTAFFGSALAHGFYTIVNLTTPNLGSTVFTNSWTQTQWQDWGTKLASAFGSTGNILWIVADDYFGTIDSNLNALLASMRAGGASQPIGIQWYQETSCRKDIYDGTNLTTANNWARDAQYNFGYSYNVWYDVTEKMGNEVSPIPYFAADGTFLNTGGITSITDKQLMRRQVWWALSSGSKGFQVGDNNIWTWASTALAEVTTNTFYTAVVPAISSYFRGLPNWYRLKADTSNLLVTAGRGTHASPLVSGGSGGQYLSNADSYVTASYTPDGTLAVIYMSHGSTITIDESKMVAGYTATWVDPKTCATSAATPGTTYNSTAKGTNSDGEADWVLVLQQGGSGLSTGATIGETFTATSAGTVAASTGASRSETFTATSAGQVAASTGASIALAFAITATGVVATSTGASRSETFTATSAGTVAASTGATIPETFNIASAGTVAASTGATIPLVFGITAAGTVTTGLSSGSVIAETFNVTSAGAVAASTGASVGETFSVTASGVVAASTSASIGETFGVASAGTVAASTGASRAETFTVTSAGSVAASTGAAIGETFTITAAGSVSGGAPSSGSSITEVFLLTSAGQVATLSGASLGETFVVTSAGVVKASTGAAVPLSFAITATGISSGAHTHVVSPRLVRVPYENRTVTLDAEDRTIVVQPEGGE